MNPKKLFKICRHNASDASLLLVARACRLPPEKLKLGKLLLVSGLRSIAVLCEVKAHK